MADGQPSAHPGDRDLVAATDALAERLPAALAPLARVAYNMRWTWARGGADLFATIDRNRWRRVGENPVRMLHEASARSLERVAADPGFVERVASVAELSESDRRSPSPTGPVDPSRPVAFLCAEYGLHPSLPFYSGGLGVLAGDILKAASDLRLPMVAVGLLYRNGYFHQRLDPTGMQHEYWVDIDPELTPCVQVTDDDGDPLTATVPLGNEELTVHVWRLDVGRVPLYLLDSDVDGNSTVGRWVTARLYESNPQIRLAQYAVLGVGGARALERMGIHPALYHLNEGHPALVAAELVHRERAAGATIAEAHDRVRDRIVFTTHTPVPAGNETYARDQLLDVLDPVASLFGGGDALVSNAWTDAAGQPGLTALALRMSRAANGVSRRHGEVARSLWQPLFAAADPDEVPIGHITNGVHVATWLRGPMRELLDAHLGEGWLDRAHDPATWAPVDEIPDGEIWSARNAARTRFLAWLRRRATEDRLRRGETTGYANAAEHGFAEDRLTLGFARRLASYKRLHLLSLRPRRALELLDSDRPVQLVFAGKAHPADQTGKEIVRRLFELKADAVTGDRVAFVEDYDLASATQLVSGCDVWINLPRPPQEASGTSGMKSVLNGGLQLSVLDGWWAEAYDGTNGWAIDGAVDADAHAQDERHADALLDLLEQEVVPLFHDRGPDGVPHGWVAVIKASLRSNGPRFSAARMVSEYADRVYARPGP